MTLDRPTTFGLIHGAGLPTGEARRLLAYAAGVDPVRIVAGSVALDDDLVARFQALAHRRREGEPMAYVVGSREFFGRDFDVDSRVLIPRHETELLVELGLQWLGGRAASDDRPRVLDLGTGSGIVGITIALEHPDAVVTATDVAPGALAVAIANAERLGATVGFVESNWFDALAPIADARAGFDLVVSNPPYIALTDPHLGQGDLRFEPPGALTDFGNGLDALTRIVAGSIRFLRPGGRLLVEHGHDQAASVRERLADAGFVDVATTRDLALVERVSGGTWGAGATDAVRTADL